MLRIVQKRRGLLKATDNRRGKMFGQIKNDSFLRNITGERFEEKRGKDLDKATLIT